MAQPLRPEAEQGVGGQRVTLPVGRWVVADAALEASAAAGGVARRGAVLLGVPESTFRRILRRAMDEATAGLATRPDAWEGVRASLRELLGEPNKVGEDRIERLELLVLREILTQIAQDGRQLLNGTSPATSERFGETVFHTIISRTVRFPETNKLGEPITTYAPSSMAAEAYRQLARELLTRL